MEILEHTTVGEIAAASAAAASVLEKYGIDYCCGGKRPLEDACRDQGLPPANVRAEIAQAVAAPLTARNWNAAPLRDLIVHIVGKHHEYLKAELPRLGGRLRKVVQTHGEKDPATLEELETVYRGLWRELEMHMHKEEMMLFPFIERYEAAAQAGAPLPRAPFGSIANPIAVMEREHDGAGGALARIRELTRDFQAPEYACATYRAMLEGLKALEADLHTHIHLENNILFPRAIALEAGVSRTHCKP
jgi:regulator of cell morphogenesis and NO signaling